MRLKIRPQKKQISRRPYSETRKGVCCQCPAGCGLTMYFSKDAKPVDLFGDEMHPVNKGALCPKAMGLYWQLNHASRLQKPAVRKSTAEPWKETDWDTALHAVAELLQKAGKKSLIVSHPSDPLEFSVGAERLAEILQLSKPSSFDAPAFGEESALKRVLGVSADKCLANSPRDWCASKIILLVGGDLALDNPITFGPLQDARDRGSKLFYIGSRGGMSARKASDAWIVQPGTESVLLAAVLALLIKKGAVDAAFVRDNAAGMESLKEKLALYTPEKAAELCGIEAERILELAELVKKYDPLQVILGQLEQRRWIDDSLLTVSCALVALKGCFGRPGGGLNILGSMPAVGAADFNTVAKALESVAPEVFIGFGDSLQRVVGQKQREAFKKIKNVIHIGSFDNATRALATVSLPVAHWTECAGLVLRSNGRAAQWHEALTEPLGDSLPPLQIWKRLLALLDPKADFEADPRKFADRILASHPFTAGLSVRDLINEESGGVLWPCPAGATEDEKNFEMSRYVKGNVRGKYNILFEPYSRLPECVFRFPTEDGLIHLEKVVLPSLNKAPRKGLSLIIASPVDRAFDHPQDVLWSNGDLGLALRVNVRTAAELGISNGSAVRVKSAFGTVETKLVCASDIPDGIAVLPPENGLPLVEDAPVLESPAVTVEKI